MESLPDVSESGNRLSACPGDIRRAVAATERLVLLGDAAGVSVHPCERRDLAVLLLHAEMPERAMVEMRAFAASSAAGQDSAEVSVLVTLDWGSCLACADCR